VNKTTNRTGLCTYPLRIEFAYYKNQIIVVLIERSSNTFGETPRRIAS